MGGVDELMAAFFVGSDVGEKAAVLITVPRALSDELVAKEKTLFVVVDLRDRAVSER